MTQPHGVYDAYYWGYELPDLEIADANEDVYNYDQDYSLDNQGESKKGDPQFYEISYSDFFWLHMDLTGPVKGKKIREHLLLSHMTLMLPVSRSLNRAHYFF